MLHLDLFVFKEPNQKWSYNLHIRRCCRPLDLLAKALVIVTFEIHIKGVFTLCHDKHLSELIKDGHCYPCEIYTRRLILSLFLRGLLVTFFASIKHRKSLNGLALPKVKPCNLLAITLIKQDFDILSLAIFICKEEYILILNKVDTIQASDWTVQIERREKAKLFFVIESE